MPFFIYDIEYKPTGKHYIGTTQHFEDRRAAHKRKPPSGMRKDVQQHGPLTDSNMSMTMLAKTDTQLIAERLETRFIAKRKPDYNIMIGAPRMHRWVHAYARQRRDKRAAIAAAPHPVEHVDLTDNVDGHMRVDLTGTVDVEFESPIELDSD